ncbi:uncharacterized protein LOC109816329 [Cajanus cajan]|uniref:DUF4228 domain-containing protein n=1 Tax=Cajanus cajan TaxID=3821 RepID=A0A151RRU4_CAJCA|nr:uncharacterized protein LOC109816329 [Cajanus cajan]KYP45263.1 hypothetical protein KK1_033216 [Cajanus cajan]
MGNCLVLLQEDVVRVMKSDGKILEYKAPIKVDKVMKQFPGQAISESLPLRHHLHPNTRLLQGQLYYLVPLPAPKVAKKRERLVERQQVEEGDVVRVKLVLSKQELKDMLRKGGVSVNEVLALAQGVDVCRKDNDGSPPWKPALETILE